MLAAPLLLCHLALVAVGSPGDAPLRAVSILLLAFAAHAFVLPRLGASRDLVALLAVAAVLRVVLLPLPPTLSDDVLRYRWDGRVVTAGHDPYRLAPEAVELEPLRDELWLIMPHKEVPTVYPPVALGVFAAVSSLPGSLLGLKIVLAAADWAACWLLMLVARRLGHAPGRAVAYAWSPLPCLETAGMGHVDALVVLFSVAAVLLLARRAPAAGIAAAAAVASKLVPLLWLPAWLRHAPRRLAFATTAALCTALFLAPMVVPSAGPPPGLVTFGVSWEFNGPLYEPLWRGLDAVDAAPTVKRGLDRLKEWSGQHEALNRVYPFVYPQLLAKLLLAAGFGLGMLWLLLRRRSEHTADDDGALSAERDAAITAEAIADTGRTATLLLLAMATVYPWYLLWVLPWAALAHHRAWLVVAATSVLSYLPQHLDGLELFPWVWLVVWAPLLLFAPVSRWRPRIGSLGGGAPA